jgi:hypothetical protein
MKLTRFLVFVLTIGTFVLSACGAAAATPAISAGAGKAEALPVAFVGIVDSIAGDQWVISGTTVTVKSDVVRDGPFATGDQVKVEGIVNTDGSFTVSRVEAPTPQDASSLPAFGNDNSNEAVANDNSADANINDDNSNAANTNDDNGNDVNSNDDNGANSNDDNGNTANSNDDNGGATNTNDDNSNGGGSNDNGDDDGDKSGKGGGGDDNDGSGKGGGDD